MCPRVCISSLCICVFRCGVKPCAGFRWVKVGGFDVRQFGRLLFALAHGYSLHVLSKVCIPGILLNVVPSVFRKTALYPFGNPHDIFAYHNKQRDTVLSLHVRVLRSWFRRHFIGCTIQTVFRCSFVLACLAVCACRLCQTVYTYIVVLYYTVLTVVLYRTFCTSM